MSPVNRRRLITVLIVIAILKGVLWAAIVPKWMFPDELAYWGDIKVVADQHRLPGYGGAMVSGHPPLYPLVASPLFLLASALGEDGQVLAVRFLAIVLGAIVTLLGWRIAQIMAPESPLTQLLAPLFLAFSPQLSFVMASTNSDALLIALFTLALYEIVVLLVAPRRWLAWALPLTVVAGIFTKERFLILLPPLFIGLLCYLLTYHYARLSAILRLRLTAWRIVAGSIMAYVIAVAVSQRLPFLAHRTGAVGAAFLSLRAEPVQLYRYQPFAERMWREFWGYFAWLNAPMSNNIYAIFTWLTRIALLGLLIGIARSLAGQARTQPATTNTDQGLTSLTIYIDQLKSLEGVGRFCAGAVMVTTIALTAYATAAYQVYGAGAQGRYLLVAAAPVFLFLALGLEQLVPGAGKKWAAAAGFLGLLALNSLALFVYVVGFHY